MQMANQQQEIDAAEKARVNESDRQARLSQGVGEINRQFDSTADNAYGGFNDDYYNKFRQAQLDYYQPELEKQYAKSKETLAFDHARAGTTNSSMASQNLADLAYQHDLNSADIVSRADAATGEQRRNVNSQKQALIGQLYSTENPEIASNLALNSVKTLQNQQPQFSTIGELFKNAVVGASNAYTAYSDPYARLGKPNLGSAGRNVG
jgi:hypothetical protein